MADLETTTAAPEWQPKFPLDLDTAKPKLFDDIKGKFDAWVKADPLSEAFELTTGWYTITPQQAEQLLRRNRPGANRKVQLSTVQYYGHQMRAGEWPKTGQPLIFDEHGVLIDGQHRLWGCL
jgi:hypothetical protein